MLLLLMAGKRGKTYRLDERVTCLVVSGAKKGVLRFTLHSVRGDVRLSVSLSPVVQHWRLRGCRFCCEQSLTLGGTQRSHGFEERTRGSVVGRALKDTSGARWCTRRTRS